MKNSKQSVQKGYAKINLFLDVTGIMPSGLHRVSTVMQSVSLCDVVSVRITGDGRYTVSCTVGDVPLGEDNLAVKAARAFEVAVGRTYGAEIVIDKHIPMAAGLAGGSADAAAVLRALNELAGFPLSREELCRIGSALGADVPFCITGGTAFADGKGDVLHDFPDVPSCTLVIACGGAGVSTPAAYKMLDELYGDFTARGACREAELAALKRHAQDGELRLLAESTYNIFEAPTLAIRPVAARLHALMLENGALCARMSGSGPSVFGIFETEVSATAAAKVISALGITPHICKPVSRFA